MILDAKRFAIRYALYYSLAIAAILIMPLVVYIILMLEINEAKTEVALRKNAYQVISAMEAFNAKSDKVFTYPRYKTFVSGLYDANGKPVFTLLPFNVRQLTPGYHKAGGWRYFLLELPDTRYFGASSLVTAKPYSADEIYMIAVAVLTGIVMILFGFSLILLKSFSRPFETINARLDTFIKDSIHEINTPLSIINANVEMHMRKFGSNKYLERIRAAAKTLSTVYDDMEYLVKREMLSYRDEEPIDVKAFIMERIEYFKPIAQLREIAIEAKLDEDIVLSYNRTRFSRIVDNTLSNAIKYSHEHGKIEVYLKRNEQDIIFSIKDYGVGIQDSKKIFERFYRENSEKGGFGIGLSIVQKILQETGARLKIRSKYGQGSNFIYYFPIR